MSARGMSGRQIRESFLSFFEGQGHRRVPSASVVPESDPTLLFVNAGMVPFKRLFTGEETRDYTRAVSSQKVFRVSGKHNDLEEVGRSLRHQTFFEMLGNFSFGDYFKTEAIQYAWELLTGVWGMPAERLVVSVFREDDEAAEIWEREIGLSPDRIFRLDEDENFWSMGDTGPCGPCTEIHWDRGPIPGVVDDDPSKDSGRYLEFWNLVFMQFDRDAQGRRHPLPKPCVDTGAGLERVASLIQGVATNYETDLFTPILARAQDVSGVDLGRDEESDVSLRVVADHARSVTFLIGDGVLPENEGRGYVLRRILRRGSRHGYLLGLDQPFLHEVADAVIDEMGDAFPEIKERRAFILDRVRREEERFLETLSKGMHLLEQEMAGLERGATLPGAVGFKLYDTYGFPADLTGDVLRSRGLSLDLAGFDEAMSSQRTRSREAWKGSGDAAVGDAYNQAAAEGGTAFLGYEGLAARSVVRSLLRDGESVARASAGDPIEVVVGETPFYAESGGQVGDRGVIRAPGGRIEVEDTRKPVPNLVVHVGRVLEGEVAVGDEVGLEVDGEARAATVRNHSGTHLLHAALREVLGPQAMQKGSLVSPDRLRFDFTHDAPLTDEEIERIEDLVNAWIETNSPGVVREMSYPDAIASGAIAIFEEKYGEDVRVVSFGDVSTELCGGTHAGATGDIGLLKVVSEGGIAAGVRRIEALTGMGALQYLREQGRTLRRIGDLLRVPADETAGRVEKLLEERKAQEKQIAELRRARASGGSSAAESVREIGGVKVLVHQAAGLEAKELRGLVDDLRGTVKSGIVLVAAPGDGKVALALGVTPDLKDRFKAGDLVREVAALVGGKGGGRPDFAQAGGNAPEKLEEAFERLYALVGEAA